MQKLFILAAIFLSCLSCNNTTNTNETTDTLSMPDSTVATEKTDTANNTSPVSKCYAYVQNGDTIRLNIATTGDTFTGNLLYQLKEKDRNKGTLQGTIKGDTLLADYNFNAEGTQSVRQVAFLKQGNNLKEGFGEVKEEGNKMVFTKPDKLQFAGFVLTPASCE